MIRRRNLLLAGMAAPALPAAAWGQQRRALKNPLRLGVDHAMAESGLARSFAQAFGRDTGIAVQWLRGAAVPLLDALERGEFDCALTNAPDAEQRLETNGLLHDRRAVARAEFVIVGPAPKGKARDPAGIAGGHQCAEALVRIRDAAATPAALEFISANDGSGTHTVEQALWRAAKVAPAGPWYVTADTNTSLIARARARGAYAIVERGAWHALGGAPLAVLVDADPIMLVGVHAMRSFRVTHPAAKIFLAWIAGPKGRRIVAAQRGYRLPPA